MSLFDSMAIASTALEAQTTRLNTISSNMANANTVTSSTEDAYVARYPVFESVLNDVTQDGSQVGVRVSGIVEAGGEARREFSPAHPMADENGFIYKPAIDAAEEMANMMSAARSFQNAVEAINTAKQLALRTLTLGK